MKSFINKLFFKLALLFESLSTKCWDIDQSRMAHSALNDKEKELAELEKSIKDLADAKIKIAHQIRVLNSIVQRSAKHLESDEDVSKLIMQKSSE